MDVTDRTNPNRKISMQKDEIRTIVHEYIRQDFIYDESQKLDDNQSLLGSGVLDSTGILELISYLEDKFTTGFLDTELVADNFDSVNRIAEFLSTRSQNPESMSDAVAQVPSPFDQRVSS
jgi:acyl carrier protein